MGLMGLTRLGLSVNSVEDVGPLAGMMNLRVLSLSDCKGVSDLSPLRGLSLQELDLSSSSVVDITPLAHMSSLEVLRLDECLLETMTPHLAGLRVLSMTYTPAVSMLTSLPGPALEELNLSQTSVMDYAAISAMSRLRVLKLQSNNTMQDPTPLADLGNLQSLQLSQTGITDLAMLSGLSQLRVLKVAGTAVSDLSPLQHLELQELDLTESKVADLSPLSAMHSLRRLHASGCRELRDVSALSGLMHLEALHLDANAMATLQVLPLSLTKLEACDVADVSTIADVRTLRDLTISCLPGFSDIRPLAQLTCLTSLLIHCHRNAADLKDLRPLRNLPLERLSCFSKGVTDLSPLSRLNRLKYLDLDHCPVRDLGMLAKLPLEQLHLECTRISDLSPLSKMQTLVCLDISGTQAENLSPLARLTGLQVLAANYCTPVLGPAATMVRYQGVLRTPWAHAVITEEGGKEWHPLSGWLHRDLLTGRARPQPAWFPDEM